MTNGFGHFRGTATSATRPGLGVWGRWGLFGNDFYMFSRADIGSGIKPGPRVVTVHMHIMYIHSNHLSWTA
jgi:hypothetical protein